MTTFDGLLARGPEDLSGRERDVLSLITQGLSNQDIAETLYLSINSVKTYVRSAYRKIGVTRRSQAIIWGARHGMLDDFPATTSTDQRSVALTG